MMSDLLMPVRKAWWSYQRRAESRRQREQSLRAMASSDNERTRQLERALKEVAGSEFDAAEQTRFNAIEALRNKLSQSTEVLEVVNFGAGEPGENLGKAEMEAGRTEKFSLKQLCEHSSQTSAFARLMTKIVRYTRPDNCLELGTCVGMSGSYLLTGIEFAKHGRLITLEGADAFARMARTNFESLGFSRFEIVTGRFQDTLDGVLETHRPIGFAFVDGHHDGPATVEYFHRISGAMPDGGVMLFDDVKWYESMRQAWKTISDDSRSRVVVDLDVMGLVVVGAPSAMKERFALTL